MLHLELSQIRALDLSMKAPGVESKLTDVVFFEADGGNRANKVKTSVFPRR